MGFRARPRCFSLRWRGKRRSRSNSSSSAGARSSDNSRPRQVASVDEVGRNSDDDAQGGWVLEQEAWMGGIYGGLDFALPGTVTSGCRDGR
jgi:hypothetical protein